MRGAPEHGNGGCRAALRNCGAPPARRCAHHYPLATAGYRWTASYPCACDQRPSVPPAGGDARIARLKDGRTGLSHKPEHVVDLDSGAIVSVKIHHADEGDTTTIHKTFKDIRKKLKFVKKKAAPKYDCPAELIADKGYHSREVLKNLDSAFRSRISVPKANGIRNWHGDHEARRAVNNNRERTKSPRGKALLRKRDELVERSFAHCLDSGSMGRTHLHGIENIENRYVIHVAGFNLGLLMRSLFGIGTPKGWADAHAHLVIFLRGGQYLLCIFLGHSRSDGQTDLTGVFTASWSKN